MAQHTIDLPCIADTYVDENNPNTNYGSATILVTSSHFPPQYKIKCTFLNFDNSNLPEHKKIINVQLKLYATESIYIGSRSMPIFVGLIEPNWDENITTFANVNFPYTTITAWSRTDITNKSVSGNIYNIFTLTDANPYKLEKGLLLKEFNQTDGVELKFHSRENTNPPILRVVYEDVPPSHPTLLTPIGVYKDSSSEIRFEWEYNSDVGGVQKKFDIQWSTDQSTWSTISETTENTFYDMPADTLPAGNVYWRVRCYNEYDENSGYSDIQSFYAIGAPNAPAINAVPTDTARPIVTWSAFSQQVYQLQVLSGDSVVYDSSVVPGINIRSHKITAWLADGTYTIQMRIKNEYDMWSDWGSATVAISTVKPDKPSITLQRSAFGVEIVSTGLVYRSDYGKDDYVCIGVATGVFCDNTVASGREYKYFVRAVSENDTFADSDIKFIQADFRHSLIAPVSSLNNVFVFMHGLNTPPNRTYNRQPGGASVIYVGRKHPVWEPTEHISTGLSLQFYLEIWAEVEAFTAIYDQNSTVLYRDAKGRKIYGTLSNLSVADDILGYIISFTLNQVDYNEELEV